MIMWGRQDEGHVSKKAAKRKLAQKGGGNSRMYVLRLHSTTFKSAGPLMRIILALYGCVTRQCQVQGQVADAVGLRGGKPRPTPLSLLPSTSHLRCACSTCEFLSSYVDRC